LQRYTALEITRKKPKDTYIGMTNSAIEEIEKPRRNNYDSIPVIY
jgi:hypothetical protein